MLDTAQKDFLVTLAAFFRRHRRQKDALIVIEAVALIVPEDREVTRQLAYIRLLAGDFKGALAAIVLWQNHVGAAADTPAAHLLRSKALTGCGRTDDARRALYDYRRAIARRDGEGARMRQHGFSP